HGVVYLAARYRENAFVTLDETDRELCHRQFQTKAHGLVVLEEVLEPLRLDFCVLFSSLSSVLGGLGFTAYAAANRFMDAFAYAHHRGSRHRIPWISVNWDTWGVEVDGKPAQDSTRGRAVARFQMEPGEATEVFRRVLSLRGVPQIVVSTGDLTARLATWARPAGSEDEAPAAGTSLSKSRRPELSQPYAAPRSEAEEVIAEIWQALLGVDPVGIHDNFLELGGDSLLGVQLISRLRRSFRAQLSVQHIFEAPTVAGLAALVASRDDPEDRSELGKLMSELEVARSQILGQAAEVPQAASPIVPVPRDVDLPPSFSQLREWFLDQLEPGNPAYHLPAAVRLEGPFDPRALAAAVNEIVRRHEALRTTFPAVEGQPVQVVAPRLAVPVPLVDLQGLPPRRRDAEAVRLATEEAVRAFDLARGPLLRVRLLSLGARDHVICLTLHHIISDGWSMSILVREIIDLYAAGHAGKPSPLPELAVQYADFAVAQHRWLQGELLERLVSYWRERLDPPPPLLPLPLDRPRTELAAVRSEICPLLIDPALLAAVKSLGVRSGASLFMILVAAFKAVLRRWTSQDDVCIGTFTAGRNQPEIEPLIGFFLNTLVLRTDLGGGPSSDGPTFRELLDRVREVTVGAYAHQDLPFEMLLDTLQVERSTSHTPLFQVMVVLQNIPRVTGQTSDLSFAPYGRFEPRAHFDLSLWQSEQQGGLSGYLEYNALVFDLTTVQRLTRHFRNLLAAAAAAPEERISALALMSAAERQQVLGEWSEAPRRVRYAPTYPELFEARAERSPDQPAVIDLGSGDELSYGRLNRRANRLAHHLRTRGVAPEVRVGVLFERSCDLLVGILGILKAGGAYVPLDPASPRDRLEQILEDAGISLVLTHRGLDAGGFGPEVMDPDRDRERLAACSVENPRPGALSEAAAYVIYTSGSTGRPKGVVVSQRSLAWYAVAAIEHYALVPEDRVLQFSSISFDNSVEEIFPCLARGATLFLRSEEMLASTAELFRRCREWSITAMSPPTAFWHEMVAAVVAEPELFPESLRVLCVGGERMLPEALAHWRRAVGRKARLLNTYGPTEATVVATLCELSGEDGAAPRGGPPIGRPVPNARVAVVDDRLRPVPVGVAGELCIGGDGVARGYLGRPAATAVSFIPEPTFDGTAAGEKSRLAGGRLYRTGDLVRFLPDGNLEFLGRIDQQVKIRGFRIEPGEIEALLGVHPEVGEAAVTAFDQGLGIRLLVAYVVPREAAAELGTSELRDFLAGALPEYMVPAAFVQLAELPRTPSGKIDRRALPAPEGEDAETERRYVAPRDETEETLAELFAEVLDLTGPASRRVGIYDNFFELGGHSLLATRLINRVRTTFELDVPVARFFAAPNVARLAVLIERLITAELEQLSDEEVERLGHEI
ncbi:MAG: amino acid adenylation domain-containing protein, partial [bacterium]|nr:amino acid adenylation domain-containing protein [bacterium]